MKYQSIILMSITIFLSNCNEVSKFITNKNNSKGDKTQLFIEGLHGKHHVVSVNSKLSTVQTLKEQIQDFSGIPPQDQRIVFGKHSLKNDEDLLCNYGINNDLEFIKVLLKIKGGTQPGPKLESKLTETKLVFRKDLPEWTTLGYGFNIIINCPNVNCPSHNYEYFNHIHIGQEGKFVFADFMYDGVICKACGKMTKNGKVVRSFMFVNATYKIEGRHSGKNPFCKYEDQKEFLVEGISENLIAKTHTSKDWIFWNSLRVIVE